MTKLAASDVQEFYPDLKNNSESESVISFMISDVVVGMELVGENSIEILKAIMGPINPANSQVEASNSIRSAFGTDIIKNSIHGSQSLNEVKRELDFFFGKENKFKKCAVLNNCSCLIIKPHVIQMGLTGNIIDKILEEGFEISAMEMFYLNKPIAEEFFEVYRGVLPEFIQMIEHIISGPVIVMEIRQENVVLSLRDLVGPHDPEIAKHVKPSSIRAQFGIDKIRNAVHCTDLEEDGIIEVCLNSVNIFLLY